MKIKYFLVSITIMLTGGSFFLYNSCTGDNFPIPSAITTNTIDITKPDYSVNFEWQSSKIDTEGNVGWNSSLDINHSSLAFVSYYDSNNKDLKIASFDGTNWNLNTVDSEGDLGLYSTICIDSADKIHIAYLDKQSSDNSETDIMNIKYAYYDGTNWQISSIDNSGSVGMGISIKTDSSNIPHLAYFDNATKQLKYAILNGGSWTSSIIDGQEEYVGWNPSLYIDSNNKSHIAYYDITNHNLKYASNSSGEWVCEVADIGLENNLGGNPSIIIDSNNQAHISYYDYTAERLKYCTKIQESWINQVVDGKLDSNDTSTSANVYDVGLYSSIGVDANGYIHITYTTNDKNTNDTSLKYAYQGGNTWVVSTLDDTGNRGQFNSMKIKNSVVYISYYDWESGDLLFISSNIKY